MDLLLHTRYQVHHIHLRVRSYLSVPVYGGRVPAICRGPAVGVLRRPKDREALYELFQNIDGTMYRVYEVIARSVI